MATESQVSGFEVSRFTISASADDDSTAEAAVPHEQLPSKDEWEQMAAEARAEVLEPVLERAMRRAAEVAREWKVTVDLPGAELPKCGTAELRAERQKHNAEDAGELRDARRGLTILPVEEQQIPRDARDDESMEGADAAPGCEYLMSDGSGCGEELAQDGYCERHWQWVELVEDKFGIACPEDQASLRQCLQQTMALVLADKILWRDAEIVVEICRLLNRNLRWRKY